MIKYILKINKNVVLSLRSLFSFMLKNTEYTQRGKSKNKYR